MASGSVISVQRMAAHRRRSDPPVNGHSRTVAAEVSRPDLVFPDLEIRDENRRIVGCRRLARFAVGDNGRGNK